MVWYTYFFLNRGKPSTHIAALSQLSDEELKENVPPVLQRLIETADHILKGDKNEKLCILINGCLATGSR